MIRKTLTQADDNLLAVMKDEQACEQVLRQVVADFNLSLILRTLLGFGTARSL